jgi:hypothetical protein
MGRRTGGSRGIALQIGLTLAAFATVAMLPPEDGTFLLLPITHRTAADAANATIRAGAKIEGAGLFPGSLIVRGRRAELAAAIADRGFLLLRGGALLCRS